MNKIPNIYLTIDLECKRNSLGVEGSVYGKLSGTGEAVGLVFILDILKKFDLKATFFVEPFFSYKFGLKVLREICGRILSGGHEIQLHMHPHFKSNKNKTFCDELYTYDCAEQTALIGEAKEILLKCGVPELSAFRAGSFAADNNTYDALKENGIMISSNYNLDFLNRTCKISLPLRVNDAFYYKRDLIEMPITCYEYNCPGFEVRYKHMQISAVSFSEMRHLLEKATDFDLKNIVILFHTFEFITFKDVAQNRGKVNRMNVDRFLKLCDFLSQNKKKFVVKKISEVNKDQVPALELAKRETVPRMPLGLFTVGKFEQIKKRIS
ncbi:MAG: polysaccharide deacetylase family protein [Candidatus Omnitrophica bacterium]|nr:polysaccharide deacetylase family protein [Candidatus Omnitrophota bacterium]